MNRTLSSIARRLHREQHGAIALACLAALLILFMLILVMFDASQTTQAKIDVQMGADTAAYSAGATGARAMNMASFANVGKRTAVGIHNMYIFEYPAYAAWVAQMCGCCCNCTWCACPNLKCCFNCAGNTISLIPIIEGIDYLSYIFGNDLYKNLEELDAYQLAIKDITKWWSTAEAQVRGVRNNANMMVVWPDPRRSEDRYAEMPFKRSSYKRESCLSPSVLPNRNPVTAWTLIEFMVNYQVLVDRSTSSPNIASDGPREVADGSAYRGFGPAFIRAAAACNALDLPIPPQSMVPDEAAPMFLDVEDSSNPWKNGDDQLRMSTMVWSYKHTPEFGNKQRDKYDYMSQDYTRGIHIAAQPMPETGMWGMARGEFYFPPANQPDMLFTGAHRMWMFHPGWMGKLRPVMLPYESTTTASESWRIEIPQMLDDSMMTGVALAFTMFGITGVPGFDAGGFALDQAYLRVNVAPDMVGATTFSNGDPHHYIDGMAK